MRVYLRLSYNSFETNHRYGRLTPVQNRSGIGWRVSPFLYELPISNLKVGSHTIPMGGGGYFRLLPVGVFKRAARSIINKQGAYLFYMHPWEIDPDQPRVKELPWLMKVRHYMNLRVTLSKLAGLLENLKDCQFLSCSDYLRLIQAGRASRRTNTSGCTPQIDAYDAPLMARHKKPNCGKCCKY